MPIGIYKRTKWHLNIARKMAKKNFPKNPWNKGLKGKGICKSPPNCFKKGHVPWNKNLPEIRSHLWKGSKVGFSQLHKWVYKHKGRPNICEECGTKKSYRFEWANISGKYKRNLNDYKRLCLKCHRKFDKHFGENHHLSKLNNNKVNQIRYLYKTKNVLQKNIAKRFNVSQAFISTIINNKMWN